MKIRYHAQFNRDLRRLRNPSLAQSVEQIISELKVASSLAVVRGVRRLRGEGRHYRIRIGEYRLGITQDGGAIILRRLLHRSEIYRNFP